MRRALALLLFLAGASLAHADPGVPWDKAGVDWTQVPPLGAPVAFTPPRPTRLALSNGMALLVIENHRLPLVSLELVVRDAGAAQDPPGKSGLAGYTADLLDEGAGGMSALEIAARLEELGAHLGLATTHDAASVSMSTLARTLDPAIDVLARVVTQPSFDAGEAKRVHEDWQTMLDQRGDEPRTLCALIVRGVIYGLQSAYGRPGDGYAGEFPHVGLDDAKKFYAARWTARAMTLVVVGDVDTKAVAARLEAAFGAWKPAGTRPRKVSVASPRPRARLWLVDRPGAEQADVRLGLRGVAPADPRVPALDVLARLLGGTFSSRLNHRLREELGWTYGAHASIVGGAQVGMFEVSTALVTPHTVEGVAEILRMVGELTTGELPAAELERARASVIRELPALFATNSDVAGSFAGLVVNGLPDDYFTAYVAGVEKVTGKDVQKVARTLVPADRLVVVVAGDLSLVRVGLEKLLGKGILVGNDLSIE